MTNFASSPAISLLRAAFVASPGDGSGRRLDPSLMFRPVPVILSEARSAQSKDPAPDVGIGVADTTRNLRESQKTGGGRGSQITRYAARTSCSCAHC